MATGKATPYLSLQVLFTLNIWWALFFFILENGIFWWKGYMLPYKARNWDAEYFGVWMLLGLEVLRLYFGMKGNLTKHTRLIVVCIVLTMLTIGCNVYYLIAQTYVLRIEYVILLMNIILQGLELVLCFLAALRFSNQVAGFTKDQ
mmetsp:Transcript_1259/g.3499  ORF Transcript_1259/g.3499 Transcript_1259/m.3499 type:complete len:146 (-) Transcript_1259:3425-3862(-)